MKRRGAGVLWDMHTCARCFTCAQWRLRHAVQCGLGHARTTWFYCRRVTNHFQSDGNFFEDRSFFLLLLRRLTPSISKKWFYRTRNCGKNKWELVEDDTAWLCAIWTGKTARNRDWRRELQKLSTLRYLEIAFGIAVSREEKQMKMSVKEVERKRDSRLKKSAARILRLARSDRKLVPMLSTPSGFQCASASSRFEVRNVARMRQQERTFACFIKAYRMRSREIDY